MVKQYIDIDSTYRNRDIYPHPSDFRVRIENGIVHDETDPYTKQTPTFPPQTPIRETGLQLEPLAFYVETQQAPFNTIVERTYLPYIYALASSETTFLLDELPIASTVSTTTNVAVTTEFPRYVVPLDRNDNAYIGQFIQLGTSGETRKIVGFSYSSTPTVLQSGVIEAYTISGNSIFVELRSQPNNGLPPSNVDRFYQGKTAQFSNGSTRLIVNSFNDSLGKPTLQFRESIGFTPAIGSVIKIIAPEVWYVTVDSPFSTSIPPYPSYRIPIPSNSTIYDKLELTTDDAILAINSVRHADNTIGVVYQTYTRLVYLYSHNTSGTVWNTPVEIVNLNSQTDISFACASLHALDLKLINGFPTIVYTQTTLGFHQVMYMRGTSVNGSSWPVSAQDILLSAGALTPYINSDEGLVKIQPATQAQSGIRLGPQPIRGFFNDGVNYYTYPEIGYTIYENDATNPGCVTMRLSTSSYDTPVWSSPISTMTIQGAMMDLNVFLNTYRQDYTHNPPRFMTREFLIFRRDSDGFMYQYRGSVTGTWLPNVNPIQAGSPMVSNSRCIIAPNNTLVPVIPGTVATVTNFVQLPTVLWTDYTNTIWARDMGIDTSIASIFARVTGNAIVDIVTPSTRSLLVHATLNAPYIDYATGEGISNVVYASGNTIYSVLRNVNSLGVGIPAILDTVSNLNQFTTLENTDYTAPLIFYQSNSRTLCALIPTTTALVQGVQYRIREKPAFITGVGGTSSGIITGTTTTIQLPASASPVSNVYNGSFIWIYNQNIYTIPTPFHMFNDFRQIIAYDGMTRTATVASSFSGNIGTFFQNTLNWEILAFDAFNTHPVESVGKSLQEQVCYEIALNSLEVPNLILITGNRIAYYPYVYVEFRVHYDSEHHLISNNPNSTTALFKVPITNIINPRSSTFVRLRGGGMIQTIKFKPRGNFHFSVYLPDGTLFQTAEQDTESPFPPNPNVQISATFQFNRI